MRIEGAGKPEGCKLIRIQADIERGLIKTIRIKGDFFAAPEEAFERAESRLIDIPPDALADTFDRLIQNSGVEVFGISGAGLASVLFGSMPPEEIP
ncbi:MAG: hypothetical protein LBG73_02160 [Spirochaetaceae bacterium]|jgi:hypothetical protein|nr:hypothetical protein [Spirochaetaceae bacterium]